MRFHKKKGKRDFPKKVDLTNEWTNGEKKNHIKKEEKYERTHEEIISQQPQ